MPKKLTFPQGTLSNRVLSRNMENETTKSPNGKEQNMKRTTGLMMVAAVGLAMLWSTNANAGGWDRGPSRYDNRYSNNRYDPRDRGRDVRYDSRYDRRDDRRVIVANVDLRRPMPMPVYAGSPVGGCYPVNPTYTTYTTYTTRPAVTYTTCPPTITRVVTTTPTVVRTVSTPTISVSINIGR